MKRKERLIAVFSHPFKIAVKFIRYGLSECRHRGIIDLRRHLDVAVGIDRITQRSKDDRREAGLRSACVNHPQI